MFRNIAIYIILLTITCVVARNYGNETMNDEIVINSRASKSRITKHPYYAGVGDSFDDCGAAIISEKYMVTTEVCSERISDDTHYMYVGGTSISDSYPVEVEHVIISMDYDRKLQFYQGRVFDVVLLKLKDKLEFSKRVQPIDLPSGPVEDIDYGYTYVFRQLAAMDDHIQIMEEIGMTKYPGSACYVYSSDYKKISDSQKAEMDEAIVCAMPEEPDNDICNSSQGSLLVQDNVLYGLSQYRYQDCDRSGNFFTNIQSYADWLRKTMEEMDNAPPSDEFRLFA